MTQGEVLKIRLLLVIDSDQHAITIIRQLNDELDDIKATNIYKNNNLLQAYQEYSPNILVFSLKSIESSEQAYLNLYRKNKHIHASPHRSIIFCCKEESKKAYALCKENIFDHYFIDRPFYDPYLMKLIIKKESSFLCFNRQAETHKIHENLMQVDNRIEELPETQGHIQQNKKYMHEFESRHTQAAEEIQKKCRLLKEKINMLTYEDFIENRVLLDEKLNNLSDFVKQKLGSEVAYMEENITKLNAFFNESQLKNTSLKSQVDKFMDEYSPEVVILEDDETYGQILGIILKQGKYKYKIFTDGYEGVEYIKQHKPYLILLDIELPSIEGGGNTRSN